MKFLKPLILFLVLNFGALAIGNWLMGPGAQSEWYLELRKAPWTPEGWVFGAAWTFVMLCFSLYMAFLWKLRPTTKVISLFTVQFLLNISWNFLFFKNHWIDAALVAIIGLSMVVLAFLITYYQDLRYKTWLIAPYFIWLMLATSLNLYASIYN